VRKRWEDTVRYLQRCDVQRGGEGAKCFHSLFLSIPLFCLVLFSLQGASRWARDEGTLLYGPAPVQYQDTYSTASTTALVPAAAGGKDEHPPSHLAPPPILVSLIFVSCLSLSLLALPLPFPFLSPFPVSFVIASRSSPYYHRLSVLSLRTGRPSPS
jgi:hypothetical protein